MTAKKLRTPIVIVVFLFVMLILSLNITPSFAPLPKYRITVTQGNHGVIAPGTTNVDEGKNQSFTITPNSGYSIASLIVDGSPVTIASSYTFSNVQSTHSISATFAINTFIITVTQGANGVISPGTTTVNYDDSQSFTITPNNGYSIASLLVDGSSVAVASAYTFSNVQSTHSISATFAINTFTITVTQGANGVISPGTTTVDFGASRSFTITPSSGYSIASLIVDGSPVTIASSYTFNNVQADHSITATFATNTYTIAVTQGANGTISPGTTTVNYGGSQSFTINPSNGYYIVSLMVDGSPVTVASSFTFNNVTADHSISATFAINTFTITATQRANGVISPGTTTVNFGDSQSFTITPNNGYSIASLTVDDSPVTTASSYTFNNVTADHSITATFAINTFTITVNQGANGQISPETTTVDYGASQGFTITPSTGYSIASLTVDGSSVTVASSYTFNNVQATHSITATFAINTYTITVTQGGHGTTSPGTATVNYGASQTFTISPSSGYSIASLTVDGSPVTTASSYTFNNVTADHSISATFAINTYTITVTQGNHGVISLGTTTVNFGDSQSFTITPNSGYSIVSLLVDGSPVTVASSYTFSDVHADHSITATFTPTSTPTPPSTVPLHDIVISQITPSNNQGHVGQLLDFEVTIKNKGTASETFNVILYANDTRIGEQTIAAMTPTSEKNLTFQWDTSGFAKENVYSIKAMTTGITNDSDPENNIYTFKYIKMTENSTSPIVHGGLEGTTWIYLAIGSVIFAVASLLFIKKLKPKRLNYELRNQKPKDFQGTSIITDGEFPDAYSIMIVGEADSEKSVFCQQLANGYLKQGKPILYITYDQFPEEVRTNMKELGWDISSQEQKGTFTFLDAYSSTGGKQSEEKYSVKQPFALSELGIVMSMALSAFNRNSAKVFLDSTSPLFTRVDPSKVVEFLQDRIAKVKGENAMFFFTVGKGTIQENFQRRLEEIVDCVLELELQKEKRKIVRKMRFKKLRGQNQPNLEITIDIKEELTLSILKTASKSKK